MVRVLVCTDNGHGCSPYGFILAVGLFVLTSKTLIAMYGGQEGTLPALSVFVLVRLHELRHGIQFQFRRGKYYAKYGERWNCF